MNSVTNKNVFSAAVSEDGKRGIIRIEGEITHYNVPEWYKELTGDNYCTPKDFTDALNACSGCSEIEVQINSLGGATFTGIAIYNALCAAKKQGKKVITRVEGIAASAASAIFCAGDERIVYPGSIVMIHGAWTHIELVMDVNVKDLEDVTAEVKKCKQVLTACDKSFAAIYAKTTGQSEDDFLALCAAGKEKWYTGEEALEAGLATTVDDSDSNAELRMVASAGKTALYSGKTLLCSDFHDAVALARYGIKTAQNEATPTTEPKMSKQEEKTAPVPETKVETPVPAALTADEKAAIAENARKEERARIAAINARAAILGDRVSKELTERAISSGMTPEAYSDEAVQNMKPEPVADAGTSYIQARAQEMSASAGVEVTPAPEPVNPNSPDALAENYIQSHKNDPKGVDSF